MSAVIWIFSAIAFAAASYNTIRIIRIIRQKRKKRAEPSRNSSKPPDPPIHGEQAMTDRDTERAQVEEGADGVDVPAPVQPTLLDYDEIEAIVAEVRAKYPNSQQAAHYAADRAQRAVLKRNAGVAVGRHQTFCKDTPP